MIVWGADKVLPFRTLRDLQSEKDVNLLEWIQKAQLDSVKFSRNEQVKKKPHEFLCAQYHELERGYVIIAVSDKYILLWTGYHLHHWNCFAVGIWISLMFVGRNKFSMDNLPDSQLDEEKLLELFSKVKLMKVDSESPHNKVKPVSRLITHAKIYVIHKNKVLPHLNILFFFSIS